MSLTHILESAAAHSPELQSIVDEARAKAEQVPQVYVVYLINPEDEKDKAEIFCTQKQETAEAVVRLLTKDLVKDECMTIELESSDRVSEAGQDLLMALDFLMGMELLEKAEEKYEQHIRESKADNTGSETSREQDYHQDNSL